MDIVTASQTPQYTKFQVTYEPNKRFNDAQILPNTGEASAENHNCGGSYVQYTWTSFFFFFFF